jgi:hypothetical protein
MLGPPSDRSDVCVCVCERERERDQRDQYIYIYIYIYIYTIEAKTSILIGLVISKGFFDL